MYGLYKSLYATLLEVAPPLQDGCIAWPRKRALVQLLVLGQAKLGNLPSHFVNLPLLFRQDVILKESDNRIHLTGSHPKLTNLDLLHLHLGKVA